jgi:hypothetical protein
MYGSKGGIISRILENKCIIENVIVLYSCDDQVKKDEMGWAYRTLGRYDIFL